jgi:hypothetical protein
VPNTQTPTCELCEGAQHSHCGDENCDLDEQEYLQVASTAHLVTRTASSLHADGEAGHDGSAGEENDDGYQQCHDRHQKPEHEGVVVQEPARQQDTYSSKRAALL